MTRRLDVRLLAPLAGFLLSYLLSGPACADERVAAHMRQTLVGVRAVAVLVIGVDSDIQRAGLSKSTLKSDVEVKLRQAGLLVVEPSSSDGIVWVEVVALDRDEEEPRYAYAMNLQFWQRVSIERNGSRSGAITWQTSLMVGIAGSGRFTDLARQTIRDNVDTFLTAYLSSESQALAEAFARAAGQEWWNAVRRDQTARRPRDSSMPHLAGRRQGHRAPARRG